MHRHITLEEIIEKLREEGVRVTHQRYEILREIARGEGHPSVSEVFHAVRERVPTISLDTVYRTLRKLSALDLVHPVGYSSEGIRFDADRTPHHHFLCSVCGKAYDFTCDELDRIPVPEAAYRIGQASGARIEVRGICRKCMREEGKGNE